MSYYLGCYCIMPYTIRRRKNCYQVINRKSKRVFSKCTTELQAKKQIRLLRAIAYGKGFVPNSRLRRSRKKI